MTPKEKAIELANKYYNDVAIELDNEFVFIPKDLCKQCALIAVDEIIKSNPCYEDSDRGGNFQWNDNTYYWQEVKNEIYKL